MTVLHNILPTFYNLYSRRVINEARCPPCGFEYQVDHSVLECPFAVELWTGLNIRSLAGDEHTGLQYMFPTTSSQVGQLIAITIESLWWSQNRQFTRFTPGFKVMCRRLMLWQRWKLVQIIVVMYAGSHQ